MPRRRPTPEIQAGISARRVPVVKPSGKRHWKAAPGKFSRPASVVSTGITGSDQASQQRRSADAARRRAQVTAIAKLMGTMKASWSSPQEQRRLAQAGLTIAPNPKAGLATRFAQGGLRFALGTPAFAYEAGSAGVQLAKGHPKPALQMGKGMVRGAEQTVRHPGRDPFQTLLLGAAMYGGGASALTRGSAATRTLRAGEGGKAALTKPGYKGGSVLHTPAPRETTLTMGGKSVQRLEPDAPGLRPFHRARTKRLQKQLDAGPRPEETWRQAWSSGSEQGGVVGKAGAVARRRPGLNAEDVFGREWRAFRRIDPVKGQGYADALVRETQGLSPDELTAMRVALIEGRHAFRNPDEAVSRHIQTHLGYAGKGIKPELHQQIARDLAPAAAVLRNPSREFLQATARARQLSRRMSAELQSRGLLSPESAVGSRVTMAHTYGRLPKGADLVTDKSGAAAVRLPGKGNLYALEREVRQAKTVLAGEQRKLATLERAHARPPRSGGKARARPKLKAQVEGQRATVQEWEREVATAVKRREAEGPQVRPVGEFLPPGASYFPSGPQFTIPAKPPKTEGYSPRPSPLGIGPKSLGYGRQGTLKHRTGEGPSQGVVSNPAEAIASAYHGHQLGNQAMDFYKQAWDAGSDVKTHPDMVGVRSTAKSTKEHRLEIQRAVHEGDETALAKALDAMTQDTIVKGGENMPVGHRIDGVRWLPKAAVKDLRTGVTDHIVMQAARAVNAPVRFAQVYVRPAYVFTNLPQNYLLGAVQHGPITVGRAMGRAQKLHGTMTGDLIARAMGTSRTESYRIGAKNTQSLVSRWGQRWTHGITGLTDRHFRDAMFLTRARERGFVSDADLSRLVNDPALHNDFVAVTRRARKDAVDFDSLTPRERQIAEAAYFYPWMSRATVWAGRTIANRPVTSAVLSQGAAYSSPRMEKKLGKHASWMDGYIKSRLGVSNAAPVSPYSTPGQIGQSVDAIAHGKSVFSELGTPFFQMGGAPLSGQGPGGIRSQLGATFPGNVLKRAGVNPKVGGSPIFGKPSATWTDTGPRVAAGTYLFGGPFPRQPNAQAQRAGFLKDQSPGRRALLKVYDTRQAVWEAAKASFPDQLQNGKLPPRVQKAFALEAERQSLYAEAAHGKKAGTPEYHLAKLKADLQFLTKHGSLTEAVARKVYADSRNDDITRLKATRADISRRYYQAEGAQLWYITPWKKEAGLR